MQQQFKVGDTKVIGGKTYVRTAAGWIPQQGVVTKPEDPALPYAGDKAREGLRSDALGNQFDAATMQDRIREAAAQAAKAQAEADAAQRKLEQDERDAAARDQQNKKNIADIELLIDRLDKLQADVTDSRVGLNGLGETGFSGARLRGIEGTAAYDLGGSVQEIQGSQFMEAIRAMKSGGNGSTGVGQLTEQEGARILAAMGNLDPNQSQETFLKRIEDARSVLLDSYRRAGGNNPKIDPEAAKQKPPVDPPAPPKQEFAKGGVRDEIDPVLQGVAGRIGQMMVSGEPDSAILKYMRDSGVNPADTNINDALQYRKTPDFKAWQRANPGRAYEVGPNFYTRQVPLTTSQNIGNIAGQSAPGAAFINFASGLTGNRLDEIAGALGGDPEAVRTGVDLSRAESPVASFAGDLAGQGALQYMSRYVPGLRNLPSTRVGRIGEDALYGVYAGSGEDGLEGGLAGGALNAVGGVAGRSLAGVGSAVTRGIQNPNLRYLHNAGVDLTPGRIARGSGGSVGDIIGRGEERLSGLPPFESIINTARRQGDESFNRAAFREAGGSGATGAAGIGELDALQRQNYSFLDNTNLPIDAQFAGRNAGVRAALPNIQFGREIGNELDQIDNVTRGGMFGGRDWQSGLRSTRANRASIQGQPFADRAVGSLDEIEGNLLDLAQRQGGPGMADNLANANQRYKQFQTLAAALDNGPAQKADELFSAGRLDDAARASQRRFGGRVSSMSGDRPFYDLASAGKEVMPNLTPDSGTAGRAYFQAALLGGGAGLAGAGADYAAGDDGISDGAAKGLALAGVLGGVYSQPGRRLIQNALLSERPAFIDRALGNRVLAPILTRRNAGMFGGAVARDYGLYPELYVQQ